MAQQGFVPPSVNVEEISRKGAVVYETIKNQYEPMYKGQYLAIDPTTKEVFLGAVATDAVLAGKKVHPESIFYVVKIGYRAVDTLASLYQYL